MERRVSKMGILINRTAKCLSYKEPRGSAGPNLAFYKLEIGEREGYLALLVPPRRVMLMAQGSYEGKAKAKRPGKKR